MSCKEKVLHTSRSSRGSWFCDLVVFSTLSIALIEVNQDLIECHMDLKHRRTRVYLVLDKEYFLVVSPNLKRNGWSIVQVAFPLHSQQVLLLCLPTLFERPTRKTELRSVDQANALTRGQLHKNAFGALQLLLFSMLPRLRTLCGL